MTQQNGFAIQTERDLYLNIAEYSKIDIPHKVKKLGMNFLRKYPRSKYVPYVRLLIAENEESPGKALKGLKIILKKYRYFKKRDYALFKICEILTLLSKWKKLELNSLYGIKNFKKSRYFTEFGFYYINALINLNMYGEALRECSKIIDTNHNYDILAKALLFQSYIIKKISGFSKKYIYCLREILLGFEESPLFPAAVFLTGRFYEEKGDFNRAYSAYRDIVKRFSGSPEKIYAEKRIKILKQHDPKEIGYLPGESTISSTDIIEISPETDTGSYGINRDSYYSISIGPFTSLKKLKEIKDLINGMGTVKVIRLRMGYLIYTGNFADSEKAMQLKIRLAEEYGINGRIVRISGKDNKKYIYED